MKLTTNAIMVVILGMQSSCASADEKSESHRPGNSQPMVTPADEFTTDTVQIYSARTWGKKGIIAHHCWLSFIEEGDDQYTVSHVIGWMNYNNGKSVVVKKDIPNRRWAGNKPNLIFEITGEKAKAAIPKIKKLIADYPYQDTYTLWPGPNSNTFVAHIIRNVEELTVELPPEAIGKDYLVNDLRVIGKSQTGTGFQFSLFGLAGFTLGLKDGIELHLLGLTFGIDILRPALKFPFVGRVGLDDR